MEREPITVTGVPQQKMTVPGPHGDIISLLVDRGENNMILLHGAFSALSSVEMRRCHVALKKCTGGP